MKDYNNKFKEWLKTQAFRDDPVGDLAEDYCRAGFLPEIYEMSVDVKRTLNDAFKEFNNLI